MDHISSWKLIEKSLITGLNYVILFGYFNLFCSPSLHSFNEVIAWPYIGSLRLASMDEDVGIWLWLGYSIKLYTALLQVIAIQHYNPISFIYI